MGKIPSLSEAQALLEQYNKEPFHLQHAKIVSRVMGYFAKEYDPDRTEFWEVVGLLHDLDFEAYPQQHCLKEQEIMKELGYDETLIHAVASHGWGLTVDIKPELFLEKVLYATDELTGLIGAAALMRPSKSVQDMELKSLKKKYKDKKFAAGCSREVIARGAELCGLTLDELLQLTLDAMRVSEDVVNAQMESLHNK